MNLPPIVRLLLWPLSVAYGFIVGMRARLYASGKLRQRRLKKPVISVGNLTVGGTGKTPMVMWLATRFLAEGKRVGILSRGYKGNGKTSDEIELMRARLGERVLFGIGKDRFEQGQRLEEQVDLLLLDDGYQHLQLARDVNLLLMDAARPLGKEMLLPAGRLRERLPAMNRADALIFTRTQNLPGTEEAIDKLEEYPVFSAATRLVGFRRLGESVPVFRAEEMAEGPYYAFCGIGNARAFFQNLQSWGMTIAEQAEFVDHHKYDERDARQLVAAAKQAGARGLLTTEKDEQNLRAVAFGEFPVYVALIDLEITKDEKLLEYIHERIEARTAAA
jgi:tetraacyldisaccharide 4'-kinase